MPKRAQDLVNVALQTKAPTLYRELRQHGTLDQFIDELALEMMEFVAVQLDRVRSRTAQTLHLDSLQSAQNLAAERSAEEQAIVTYLEFPPETTLPQEHMQAWCEPFASCSCVRE